MTVASQRIVVQVTPKQKKEIAAAAGDEFAVEDYQFARGGGGIRRGI